MCADQTQISHKVGLYMVLLAVCWFILHDLGYLSIVSISRYESIYSKHFLSECGTPMKLVCIYKSEEFDVKFTSVLFKELRNVLHHVCFADD